MAEKYVERPFYMERMMEWFDDRTMIKVLTGIRRCGKSVIMEQFRQYLINRGHLREGHHAHRSGEDEICHRF